MAHTCCTADRHTTVEVTYRYQKFGIAPNRELTVADLSKYQVNTAACMTTIPVTLEFLQSLSDTGKKEALQSAMSWCSTKELRSFCGGMGVRVRSKEYAIYHTKAGYTELLTQLLRAKSATKGIAVGSSPASIVVTPVKRTRKTKNCNLRLLNVLCSDFMAPFLSGMNAEPTQTEISTGAVGGNNPFWTRFRNEFVSNKPEYGRLSFQGRCLSGFDLSTPVPHSSTKLSEMWSELWEAYNSALTRFTHTEDANLEFADCCPSRGDVFYMRCWLEVKTNLLSEICAPPLPAGITLSSGALDSSVSLHEDIVAVGAAASATERIEDPRLPRKRPRTELLPVAKVTELATSTSGKYAGRAALMQSIRHAAEILAMIRGGLELGSEVEETVWCELQQCAKRLKQIQEKKDNDKEAEEERLSY